MPQGQRKMTAAIEDKDDFVEVFEELLARNERANFSCLFKQEG